MVIAVDIGNTNIHVALYHNGVLNNRLVFPWREKPLDSNLKKLLHNIQPEGVAIASVVPGLTTRCSTFFIRRYNINPILVSHESKCRLRYGYRKPETLGADRLANVVGGLARYDKNLIILSFGTALTIDVVMASRYYAGGLILPGIDLMFDSLARGTSLLSKVDFKKPARLIGRNTEECIQSGIYYGFISMVRGIVQQIKHSYKKRFTCVATGGWAKTACDAMREIDHLDIDLSTFGILKIYESNV